MKFHGCLDLSIIFFFLFLSISISRSIFPSTSYSFSFLTFFLSLFNTISYSLINLESFLDPILYLLFMFSLSFEPSQPLRLSHWSLRISATLPLHILTCLHVYTLKCLCLSLPAWRKILVLRIWHSTKITILYVKTIYYRYKVQSFQYDQYVFSCVVAEILMETYNSSFY